MAIAACSAAVSEREPVDRSIDTGDLGAVEVMTVTVDDVEAIVAVASTPETRSRGLRGVTDLGDLDGMIFVWGGETVTSSFTMADTLIPLDISFFDTEGLFVDGFTMTPCKTSTCPSYAAAGPYAYAIEVPAGTRPAPGPGSVLRLSD
jgi:uncharacterized membrane protein (UPF0127 family)